MDDRCYFCLESLRQPNRPIDKHHRLPKRYMSKEEKQDKTNIAYSHCDCHIRWHRIHDLPRVNRKTFIRIMAPSGFGYGIFAAHHDEQMAAD